MQDLIKPIIKFLESEKVEGMPNKIFHLVIMATVANFDISRVLDSGSSCNIMNSNLFERLGLKNEKLLPY